MNKRSGFTMIELLVVMGIIAMLITLGITGLIQFVSTVEIVETGNQTVELMDLVKNAAKNDVRPPRDGTTGDISIFFRGFHYNFATNQIEFCYDTTQFGQVSAGNVWDCQYSDSITSVLEVFEVPLIVDGVASTGVTSPCTGVYFESLTGDIYVQTLSSSITTNGDCYIRYRDSFSRYSWYIFVDGVLDDIFVFKDLASVERAAREY